ncbi:MAG: hypothetical protein KatS3mg115_2026 [Candidatus Poribacteria bacterium]|nr:MAG: hypothetical protein KatS3mg115_2026 [Candidatus Poribacteria bacterium]
MGKRVGRRFERLIPAYLEGVLTERQWRWFQRQLRRSEACRQELERYRRLYRHLDRARVEYPDPQALESFLPRLYERIAQETPEPKPRSWTARLWDRWTAQVAVGGLVGSLVGSAVALLLALTASGLGILSESRMAEGGETVLVTVSGDEATPAIATVEAFLVTAEPVGPTLSSGDPGFEGSSPSLGGSSPAFSSEATSEERTPPLSPLELYFPETGADFGTLVAFQP